MASKGLQQTIDGLTEMAKTLKEEENKQGTLINEKDVGVDGAASVGVDGAASVGVDGAKPGAVVEGTATQPTGGETQPATTGTPGGRRRSKRRYGKKGSRKSKKGAKQSKKGGRRSSKNRRKHSHRSRKH